MGDMGTGIISWKSGGDWGLGTARVSWLQIREKPLGAVNASVEMYFADWGRVESN